MSAAGVRSTSPVPGAVLVLDTNIALDLLLFDDPATRGLQPALAGSHQSWLATVAMREELERVLAYRHIASRLTSMGKSINGVMALYDRLSQAVPAAPRSPIRCGDPDDQMFVDLAVAHQALLLSKDLAVLRLKKRLRAIGVGVMTARDLVRAPTSHPAV